MENYALSSFLCQENETCFGGKVEDEDSMIHSKDYSTSEDEYVGILIEREIDFGFKKDESLVFGNWVNNARLNAIDWILKTRAAFGLRFQTAYLSVTYLDRFLCKRFIDSNKSWAMGLLSVACLSLAAKMEECDVRSLSEFHLQDFSFESRVIQRMELLVLSTLEWKMGFVTPFAFLPYLITKFCNESPPRDILSKTMQIIISTMREINLMDHRPSVIATAATLVALDQQLTIKTVELKMSSVSQMLLEAEDIFACYSLMRRIDALKSRREEFVHCPNSSPIRSRSIEVLGQEKKTYIQ